MAPNPKAIGELSEIMVLARLMELGWSVSVPFGNNQRYDLIVDDGSTLRRVQVKTGRLRGEIIDFPTCSTNGFTGAHRDYLGQAEDFIVYCHENDKVYRIPVDECGPSGVYLRMTPTRNNQIKGIRMAADYELIRPRDVVTPK